MCRTIIELSMDPKNRLDLWLQRIIIGWNKEKDLIDASRIIGSEIDIYFTDRHDKQLNEIRRNLPNNIDILYLCDVNENIDLMKNMIDYIVKLDT